MKSMGYGAVALGLALALGLGLAFCPKGPGSKLRDAYLRMRGRHTVESRVNAFAAAAESRLRPHFRRAGVHYPPAHATLAAFKHERRLELWAAPGGGALRHITTYPILGASGVLGPKLREGDLQAPEGVYRITGLNPNSRFHLSLRVDYPNEFDLEWARKDGRSRPGSDIFIHGGKASVGCLAMGDPVAEELFVLAARVGVENLRVIIAPVDFRERAMPAPTRPMPPWTPKLHDDIKAALAGLAAPQAAAPPGDE